MDVFSKILKASREELSDLAIYSGEQLEARFAASKTYATMASVRFLLNNIPNEIVAPGNVIAPNDAGHIEG